MPTLYLAPGEEARVEQAIGSEPSWRGQWRRVDGDDATMADAAEEAVLDFAWVHTDPDSAVRRRATVLSHLDHIEVLSWKNNLALLQRQLSQLPTEVIMGEDHFEAWCRAEFGRGSATQRCRTWVVKDALANGGRHVWIVSARNWRRVTIVLRAHGATSEATEAAERGGVGLPRLYVVQQYVDQPLLWPLTADLRCHQVGTRRNTVLPPRKFHWRVFGLIRGDLTCYLYPRGFAHVANAPWKALVESGDPVLTAAQMPAGAQLEKHDDEDGWGELYDRSVHITNVGVNMQDDPDGSAEVFERYPVVDFQQELPQLWTQLQKILGTTVGAATPFMRVQRSANDFALLGLDVLQDTDGVAWLLEINAPPSLAQCGLRPDVFTSAGEPKQATDAGCRPDWGADLVVRMMRDLIAQFVLPHLHCNTDLPTLAGSWVQVESNPPPEAAANDIHRANCVDSTGRYNRNVLAWTQYKRKLVREICEAQMEEDRPTHKRQRAGEVVGNIGPGLTTSRLGGLTGVALRDALLTQHREHFVHASQRTG